MDYSETVHPISEIEPDLDIELAYALPPRIPCFSHILNLIGSKDILKPSGEENEFETTYERVISQLKALWNISGRSTRFATKFKSKFGVFLKAPVVTRWNSLYDSIGFLNDLFKDGKMHLIQNVISDYNSDKTGSRFTFSLTDRELMFVDEFISVKKKYSNDNVHFYLLK